MNLFPYQVVGAEFLAKTKKALLADDPGLGKTAQAIVACRNVRAQKVLVICPASLVGVWHAEFKRFGGGTLPNVLSYNRAVQELNCWAGEPGKWDVLILDEAHYLKNPKAKRTQAIFGPKGDGGIAARAEHVFALSGTPTPNNPSELYPLLRALASAAIDRGGKPLAYWSFVTKYCRTRDNGFGIQIVGGKNLDELRERIKPFVLRRKKEDVLKDLPPIRFDELPLAADFKLPAEFKKASAEVEAVLQERGVEGLASIATHVAALRQVTGLAKVAPAVEWIKDQLDGGVRKMVVFAHHRAVLDGLYAALADNAVLLTGSTPSEARGALVHRFQTDGFCRVFLGQIQAAGVGLTLTAASDALFVESSWVPSDNEQAAMRIHRIGQRNACTVRFAMLPGSIDERVQRAVLRKATDIAKLFG